MLLRPRVIFVASSWDTARIGISRTSMYRIKWWWFIGKYTTISLGSIHTYIYIYIHTYIHTYIQVGALLWYHFDRRWQGKACQHRLWALQTYQHVSSSLWQQISHRGKMRLNRNWPALVQYSCMRRCWMSCWRTTTSPASLSSLTEMDVCTPRYRATYIHPHHLSCSSSLRTWPDLPKKHGRGGQPASSIRFRSDTHHHNGDVEVGATSCQHTFKGISI